MPWLELSSWLGSLKGQSPLGTGFWGSVEVLEQEFSPARGTKPQSWHLGDCGGRKEQGRRFSAPNWPVSNHQDVGCGGWALLLVTLGHQMGLRLATLGMSHPPSDNISLPSSASLPSQHAERSTAPSNRL